MTDLIWAGGPVTVAGRPGYEGANIRTWVGFKHFYYLVENAVLGWFSAQGWLAGQLYHQYGLGLEIVDCSALLPAVLDTDDLVTAEIAPVRPGRFSVRLTVSREGATVTVLRGKVTVALVREKDTPGVLPEPAGLASLIVPDSAAAGAGGPDGAGGRKDIQLAAGKEAEEEVRNELVPRGSGTFLWSWRAPYFYCHFSDRVQYSGYVRALEEVVDRFLADRGLAVGALLTERGWIPVVSRVRVTLLADAHMEEIIHTTFTVTDVIKGTMFDGRMDCWVRRGRELVRVATATILHGYALSRGDGAGQLAELDDATIAALREAS